jgi:hypothetical protein
MQAILAGTFSAQFHILNFTPELWGEMSNIRFLAGHPLGLFACFLCRHVKEKFSYPTQLSGPRLVKWMGRYG